MATKLGEAKITRSWQITLNKKLRDEMGVNIGDYVLFEKEDNIFFIIPAELKLKPEKE